MQAVDSIMMASAMCRIRVEIKSLNPFWMQVDFDEHPLIADVRQKIQALSNERDIGELLLQGCILPSGETSRVLRENDVILATLKVSKDASTKYAEKLTVNDNVPGSTQEENHINFGKNPSGTVNENNVRSTSQNIGEDQKVSFTGTSLKEVKKDVDDYASGSDVIAQSNLYTRERKQTRKRKRRKGAMINTSNLDNAHTDPSVRELRLPVNKQPRSRKTVFFSDNESDVDNYNNAGFFEETREEDRITEKPFMSVAQLKVSNSDETHTKNVKLIDRTGKDEKGSSHYNIDADALGMVPGKEDVKQNDDCSKQHEKKIGTILPHGKSSSPNSRCEDKPRQNQLVLEVVQPDMTQYLKMTPAERGLLLPSYMKAERLCNGAVKYTRTTDPLKNNTFHLTDNFSSPSGRCRLPAIETKMQLTTYNDHNTSDAVNSALWPSEKLKIKDFLADTNSEESIKITAAPLFCNFSKLPDLRAAPKIGDFIAYKVLELGEDYMPRISEYKEAEVLYYDEESKSVTLRLCHQSKQGERKTAGKLDLPYPFPQENITTEVILEVASLLQPKVLPS